MSKIRLFFRDNYHLLNEIAIWYQVNEFTTAISNLEAEPQNSVRVVLAQLAAGFHKRAGTYQIVRGAIDRLIAGAPIIHIVHQPNTFISLNVLGLVLLAEKFNYLFQPQNDKLKPVILFVGLDYDSAGDKRFRSPIIPDLTKSRFLSAKGIVAKKARGRVALSVPSPSSTVITKLIDTMYQSAIKWRILFSPYNISKKALQQRRRILTNNFLRIYSSTSIITDANLQAISWFTNNLWEVDSVLFVPASQLLLFNFERLLYLIHRGIQHEQEINESLYAFYKRHQIQGKLISFKHRGLWRVCPKCLERKPVTVLDSSAKHLTVKWKCAKCGIMEKTEEVSRFEYLDGGVIPKFVPTIIACEQMDTFALDSKVNLSYAGGIEHLIWSKFIRLHLDMDLGYDFVWEPRNVFPTKVLKLADAHAFNIPYEDVKQWASAFRAAKFPASFYWMLGGGITSSVGNEINFCFR